MDNPNDKNSNFSNSYFRSNNSNNSVNSRNVDRNAISQPPYTNSSTNFSYSHFANSSFLNNALNPSLNSSNTTNPTAYANNLTNLQNTSTNTATCPAPNIISPPSNNRNSSVNLPLYPNNLVNSPFYSRISTNPPAYPNSLINSPNILRRVTSNTAAQFNNSLNLPIPHNFTNPPTYLNTLVSPPNNPSCARNSATYLNNTVNSPSYSVLPSYPNAVLSENYNTVTNSQRTETNTEILLADLRRLSNAERYQRNSTNYASNLTEASPIQNIQSLISNYPEAVATPGNRMHSLQQEPQTRGHVSRTRGKRSQQINNVVPPNVTVTPSMSNNTRLLLNHRLQYQNLANVPSDQAMDLSVANEPARTRNVQNSNDIQSIPQGQAIDLTKTNFQPSVNVRSMGEQGRESFTNRLPTQHPHLLTSSIHQVNTNYHLLTAGRCIIPGPIVNNPCNRSHNFGVESCCPNELQNVPSMTFVNGVIQQTRQRNETLLESVTVTSHPNSEASCSFQGDSAERPSQSQQNSSSERRCSRKRRYTQEEMGICETMLTLDPDLENRPYSAISSYEPESDNISDQNVSSTPSSCSQAYTPFNQYDTQNADPNVNRFHQGFGRNNAASGSDNSTSGICVPQFQTFNGPNQVYPAPGGVTFYPYSFGEPSVQQQTTNPFLQFDPAVYNSHNPSADVTPTTTTGRGRARGRGRGRGRPRGVRAAPQCREISDLRKSENAFFRQDIEDELPKKKILVSGVLNYNMDHSVGKF